MTHHPFRVEQIDHVEMFVPDRYEAAKWYERVLGLSVLTGYEDWAANRGGPLMISSDGGLTKLAIFEGTPQGDRATAGFHRVAFRVSGPAFLTFLDALTELGLTDHRDRPVTPDLAVDHGRAFSIYFVDPFGHHLEITTYDHDEVRRGIRDSGFGIRDERIRDERIRE
ncbi:MAG: VOC family protein [Vicinamibacterales bacterium]